MNSLQSPFSWEDLQRPMPLNGIPHHYAVVTQTAVFKNYLRAILDLCPRGARTCELGDAAGYGAIWLSLRGIQATTLCAMPQELERVRQINSLLTGQAVITKGDPTLFFEPGPDPAAAPPLAQQYQVIHHCGLLHRFNVPWIRALLAQQARCAQWVVFSVPSVYYPNDPHTGAERLLPLAEWTRILEPFTVRHLDYYDESPDAAGADQKIQAGQEYILGIIKGQGTDALRPFMTVPAEPYPEGISAIVHTRNEAHQLADCLRTLQAWTDEIIVCDMESHDDTIQIARQYTDNIVLHPRIANFDRARNVSAMRAKYRWVFYLDADERVPSQLGAQLRQLIIAKTAPDANASHDDIHETQDDHIVSPNASTSPNAAPAGVDFNALSLPFRHYFVGHWMRSLYPGYKAPQLFKNGTFYFQPRLHAGAYVEGRHVCFAAHNPELAITHHAFDSLTHYLQKLNHYTTIEATNLWQDEQRFHWRNAIRAFVDDFQLYYERRHASNDGMHGFLFAFLSGFYRFQAHAKLFEQRFRQSQLQPSEIEIPGSLEQVLEYALEIVRHTATPSVTPQHAQPIVLETPTGVSSGIEIIQPLTITPGPVKDNPNPQNANLAGELALAGGLAHAAANETVASDTPLNSLEDAARANVAPIKPLDDAADLVWSGPFYSPSGYGEESQQLLLALQQTVDEHARQRDPSHHQQLSLAAHVMPSTRDEATLEPAIQQRLERLWQKKAKPGFIQIIHNVAPAFRRHPGAGVVIGRTMFETDRLPREWVQACNNMDYIWVPSKFNQASFALAGVDPQKLVVMPSCLDATFFDSGPAPQRLSAAQTQGLPSQGLPSARPGFTFLTTFDWLRRKGWDILLKAFLSEFGAQSEVKLLLHVGSSWNYDAATIQQQATTLIQHELELDLATALSVRFVHERLSRQELWQLFSAADAFVLPTRGEGWGRPLMEAMAQGLPVIATGWGGHRAFMTPENSYLINYQLVAVGETGWREMPVYQGHRWAEPDQSHLRQLMRRVYEERSESRTVGQRARETVQADYNPAVIGQLVFQEIERVREALAPHPISIAPTPLSQQPNGLARCHSGQGLASETPTDAQLVPLAREIAQSPLPPSPPAGSTLTGSTPISGSNPIAPAPADSTQADSAQADPSQRARVRWEGAQFVRHSLARVNREFCLGLLATNTVELSIIPHTPHEFGVAEDYRFGALAEHFFAPLEAAADVHIRHFFPPRFSAPPDGQLVLMQPWEYGYLPALWVEQIKQQVSEVWCYSHYVREVYRASQVPEDLLHVLPLGVNADVFTDAAPPYIFTTEPGAAGIFTAPSQSEAPSRPAQLDATDQARFVFLFVGGSLHRKGIDILLDAYYKAFSAFDEVCLVIKDTGTNSVYRGSNERERIFQLIDDPTRPPIIYLEHELPDAQLAGLYTACDCLVQPYRGEGFCLPALEAMSCGRAVIVTAGGPTDDFVDSSVGWQIPAKRNNLGPDFASEWDCVGEPWMLEVNSADLARLMRHAYSHREEVTRKGQSARERVLGGWTWAHSCAAVLKRLHALQARPLTASPEASTERAINPRADALHLEEDLPRSEQASFEPSSQALTQPAQRQRLSAPVSPKKSSPRANGKATPLTAKGSPAQVAAISASAVSAPGQRSQPTISLCMIVRNEERVLDECLHSVKPWVDEIIVVDTGSSDRTKAIAQRHGVRLSHFLWCDDFSAARNESLRHATGDWIFWMDADDTLPEICGRQMRELVSLAPDAVTGYLMQVHIPPAPGETGFTIVDHVKLFRNLPGLHFIGRIHEQILEPIYRQGGRVDRSDLYVIHSGYDYSPEGQQRKRARDLLLLQKDLQDRPDHPFVLFNIGMTAYHLKNFDQALPALERCLALSKPRESTVRKVYAMLAGCHLEQSDLAQAATLIQQGLQRFPNDPELLFRAGIIYREQGNLVAAEQSYIKLLTAREVGHIDSLDISMTSFKARHNLALIYQDMQQYNKAEEQWQAALRDNPAFVPSWLGLGELYLQRRRTDDVRTVIATLNQYDRESATRLQQRLESLHKT